MVQHRCGFSEAPPTAVASRDEATGLSRREDGNLSGKSRRAGDVTKPLDGGSRPGPLHLRTLAPYAFVHALRLEQHCKRRAQNALGSVLNHVSLHQTVIGQEAIRQMELAGEEPDIVIGCVGGGSNFAGIAFPFLQRQFAGQGRYRIIAVEPRACASLTRGTLRYDFGDTAQMTPLLWMYSLGADFIPPKIHAGGLRYHGMAPTVSHAYDLGLIEAKAYPQTKVFEAATFFARHEGTIPAPEPSHAICAAIEEAVRAREEGKKKVILFNLCGHGLLDLSAYDAYLAGQLRDEL